MIVGAGTVTTKEHIDATIVAGGQFIVTPGFDPELVAYAQEKNIPIYPGCTIMAPRNRTTGYEIIVNMVY